MTLVVIDSDNTLFASASASALITIVFASASAFAIAVCFSVSAVDWNYGTSVLRIL